MKLNRKLITIVGSLALLAASVYLIPASKLKAQLVTIVGGTSPVNEFPQSAVTGLAGGVTNPSSNFVIEVAGGPVYFAGGISTIAQAKLTLPASSTNLVVWNGQSKQLYAKQAVTGPGSPSTSSGSSLNSPGTPTSLLYAVPGVEIPLAQVVCNATACGNGGNGTITDKRTVGNFPAGQYIGGHLNQSAAGTTTGGAGTMQSTAGICTASSATTCVVTFSTAFQSAPACMVTDQTTTANGALKALPTTTNLTITTSSSSDTFSYLCVGNPN